MLLFFDIDGTIVNSRETMPESAGRAVRLAKENGHRLFLATGRSFPTVQPWLFDYGFDGIIVTGGARVMCEGEPIFLQHIDPDKLRLFDDYCKERGYMYAVQGYRHNYVPERVKEEILKIVDLHEATMSLGEGYAAKMATFDDVSEVFDDAEKLSFYFVPDTIENISRDLGDYFNIMPFFPVDRDAVCGEIHCGGLNKAIGVTKLAEYFHEPIEDTIAFGDGPNDIEMLQAAGLSVCMGNGAQVTKDASDIVADTVDNDGLYKIMKELKLI